MDQPPTEIDPGDTATFYIAPADGGLPEVIGNVTYSVTDNSVGFFMSGVKINFDDPPTAANSASSDALHEVVLHGDHEQRRARRVEGERILARGHHPSSSASSSTDSTPPSACDTGQPSLAASACR